MDRLNDLPRCVAKDSYQTVLDDKSGYDHILLTDESRTFFGIPYLGFLADSSMEVFHLIPEKKHKFVMLVQNTLQSTYVSVKTLQRLVGKCTLFFLGSARAERLFTREMNAAISKGIRSQKSILLRGTLRADFPWVTPGDLG